jgi:DNA-binding MarR family transcriptional regulator
MNDQKDYFDELGHMALASRLRRLLGVMHSDGERVYRKLQINFKPKWFPIIHLLNKHKSLSLTNIAKLLNMAHPSVIETIRELTDQGLVSTVTNESDKRKKDIQLTTRGINIITELRPVWEAFKLSGIEVSSEFNNDFMTAIIKFEAAIERKSFYSRILEILKEKSIK